MAAREGSTTREGTVGPHGLWVADYLAALRRHLGVMACVVAAAAGGAAVWVFAARPVYRASATILVEQQAPRATSFEEVLRLQATRSEHFRTQLALLRSRAVLERVAEPAGVADWPDESSWPGAARADPHSPSGAASDSAAGACGGRAPLWMRLRDCVAAEYVPGTHLIVVHGESAEPARAALLANAVARAFRQYHAERKHQAYAEASQFLQAQKAKQEQRVAAAEAALAAFHRGAPFVASEGMDGKGPLLSQRALVQEELTRVRLQRGRRAGQHASLREALARQGGTATADDRLFTLPAVRGDAAVTALRTALVNAEAEAVLRSGTHGAGSREARAATMAAGSLRAQLDAAVRQLADALAAELDELARREDELAAQCAALREEAGELASGRLTFDRLRNDVERERQFFDLLVERMREVDVGSDYARTHIEIVEAAAVPAAAHRPRKARTVGLALLAGILLSVAVALTLDYVENGMRMSHRLGPAEGRGAPAPDGRQACRAAAAAPGGGACDGARQP